MTGEYDARLSGSQAFLSLSYRTPISSSLLQWIILTHIFQISVSLSVSSIYSTTQVGMTERTLNSYIILISSERHRERRHHPPEVQVRDLRWVSTHQARRARCKDWLDSASILSTISCSTPSQQTAEVRVLHLYSFIE